MDIFGNDIDSMLETDGDDLNENIRVGDENENEENEENDENDENDDDEKKAAAPIPIEHKKRTVRNPQLRLNVERLKCDRGIHTAEEFYKDIKYLGRGHERHDLNNVMKRLEHFAHRLYPNYNFDDFLSTVEKLGKKKQVQTHMYRYRQGLLEMDKQVQRNVEDGADERGMDEAMEPIDELDEIIDQQIQNYSVAPPKTPGRHDSTFDSIRSSVIATPNFMGRRPVEASTPLSYTNELGVRPLDDTPAKAAAPKPVSQLTSDQMARIAENRRLAQERLKAKRERDAQLLREKEAEQQLEQIDEEI